MSKFEELIKNIGCIKYENCEKYCKIGKSFFFNNEVMRGVYWYYETDDFIIDIHDFFIKKEHFVARFDDFHKVFSFSSSYIKSAHGEFLSPYQQLTSNSMVVVNMKNTNICTSLYANLPYFSVGIKFKDSILKKYLADEFKLPNGIADVFMETKDVIVTPFEKIANDIINCNMNNRAAKIFFEAKAKEWLSLTLNNYHNKNKKKQMPKAEEKSLENVVNYINDNFSMTIHQDILEKIAMMSSTKLKKEFKSKYHMTITEFIQRKRINIAEHLLTQSNLEIKDIAKAVGYNSHSRFTTLFKKYKGFYPSEIKKII